MYYCKLIQSTELYHSREATTRTKIVYGKASDIVGHGAIGWTVSHICALDKQAIIRIKVNYHSIYMPCSLEMNETKLAWEMTMREGAGIQKILKHALSLPERTSRSVFDDSPTGSLNNFI